MTARADTRAARDAENASLAKYAWMALALTAAAIGIASVFGPGAAPIVAPGLAISAVGVLFFLLSSRRDETGSWLEIGPLYLMIIILYALFPLLGNLVSGGIYTELSDARMLAYGVPSPDEIGAIGWMYFAYIAAFAIAYGMARGSNPIHAGGIRRPDTTVIVAFLIFLGATELFKLYIGIAYNLKAATYAESYLVVRQLPLALRQINAFAVGGAFVAKLAVLLFLFLDFKRNRLWIALWLGVAVGSAFLQPNAERGGLFLLLLSALTLYHYVVKPVSTTTLLVLGAVGFTVYVALGILRTFGSGRVISPFGFTDFDGIFANAFDLLKRKEAGEVHLPLSKLYLGDVFVFVPQQFLPFEKFGAADWYMSQFYPEAWAEGGGAAFGAIAEGIIGSGWFDLILRGAFVGLLFAGVQRYAAQRTSFWTLLFYAWVVVYAYQCFRASTTVLLNFVVFRFLPPVLIVGMLAGLLQGTVRPRVVRTP